MLVLGRKIGEAIVIADNITVTVLDIHGGRVKLGISAPDAVSIRRAELRSLRPVSYSPVPSNPAQPEPVLEAV